MATNHAVSHFCFVVIFVNIILIGHTFSQYVLEPFDVTGVVGRDVTIYCQVEVSADTDSDVFWGLPDGEGALGPNRNTHRNYPRHSFTGDPEMGFFNLRIINVTLDDMGSYACIDRRTTVTGVAVTNEESATLSVSEGAIEESEIDCAGFADGATFEFSDMTKLPNYTCTATGGIPFAGGGDITWYLFRRNNSFVEIPGIMTVDSTGVRSTIDSAQTTLTGEDDNSYLRCYAGPMEQSTLPCRIPHSSGIGTEEDRIRVTYKPLVRVLPSEIEVGMFETFDLDIKCLADGNPPLHDYPLFEFDLDIGVVANTSTFGNDSNVATRQFSRARISITADDIGKVVNCTATNELGTTTVTLEIQFLGGLPVWLICAIILIGGVVLFVAVLLFIICCCKCDLAHERKRTERRRRTMGDGKANGNFVDDGLDDIDLHTYDQAPDMMPPPPESPVDSHYDSDAGSAAMINDFRIEEPEGDNRRVSIGSYEGGVTNNVYEEDGVEFMDQDELKKVDYTQVAMTDDTAGEDIELDDLSRGTSPSLNELIE